MSWGRDARSTGKADVQEYQVTEQVDAVGSGPGGQHGRVGRFFTIASGHPEPRCPGQTRFGGWRSVPLFAESRPKASTNVLPSRLGG